MPIEPYKTSDTPFAAYLYLKGMHLLDTLPHKTDPHRREFLFVDCPERPEYERQFSTGEDFISARDYWAAIKKVKRLLPKREEA